MDTPPTNLQDRLETIALKIGNFGIIAAVLIFCASTLRVFLEMFGAIPCGCQNIFKC